MIKRVKFASVSDGPSKFRINSNGCLVSIFFKVGYVFKF